ncbi:hypothetical protein [Bordetella genomosp. 4]|uniref:hypothetical protein n=1 Tax=Bordetella genomosp. 4 TaxID=463044 RepID=UPI000B9DE746|nr:hypothetical protein [Bordetella genomosp. 4]OZI51407.1 hypothetical protein CAL21_05720 [Bordetella genomosp. 4]
MLLRPLTYVLTFSLLAACTSMSKTTPTGPDTYQVTYNAGAKWQTWVEVKHIAREQAEAHCASMNKRMTQPKVTSNHATGLMPKEATIDFTCEPLPASAPSEQKSGS